MPDMTETENHVVTEEADLQVYILAYKSLKDSFRGRTRFVLLHIEDDIWEVRLVGLTSREWLEYCANVFAELPSETVNLAGETAPSYSETAELMKDIPLEAEDDESEDTEVEEEEYEDDDTEEEEESGEESVNSDGVTVSEEVERKLKRAKIVRKTGNAAVTVESD